MNKKKIMSLIMALVMLVGVFSPLTAFADQTVHETTVKIHKILMDKEELNKTDEQGKAVWPKDHDGSVIPDIGAYFGAKAKAINGVAFRIYKVYTGQGNAEDEGYTKGEKLIADHKLATGDLDPNKFLSLIHI